MHTSDIRRSPNRRRPTFAFALAVVAVSAAFLSGCSSDKDETLAVTDVWARSSPMMKGAGAMYATIANPSDDADELVSVSVPADVATTVELHETVAAEPASTDTGAAMTSDGAMAAGGEAMMTMRAVPSIEIPANGKAELAPGGFHVMLLEMPNPLEAGSTFEATLTFQDGGEQTVEVEVRDQ